MFTAVLSCRFPVGLRSRIGGFGIFKSFATLAAIGVLSVIAPLPLSAADIEPGSSLKLLTRANYLPANPVLVRVEVIAPDGQPDRDLWNAEAMLTVDVPGITLSTNRVDLRNGLGSALVTFSGGGNFTLTATVGSLSTNRALQDLTGASVTTVSGTLPGTTSTWNGVVHVTSTVTVPAGHTLTIAPNTLVLIDGVASGSGGAGLIVNGAVNALGTEDEPVTITCFDPALRWGQIRHTDAHPSVYQHTIITLAGRAPGEGHTGQAPVLRPSNSTLTFDHCSITDHATAAGTPGKIMYAINSDLTFNECLLARARMGPEIQGTALHCTNTWIVAMHGPDDADGIYLHDQQAGQEIALQGCVIVDGDDDAIDTLDAVITVENCILRDWPNPNEDAKGVSGFNGEITLRRCVVANCYAGVASKSSGPLARVNIDHCTITGITAGVSAAYKVNAAAGNIDFRITNSIIRSVDAVHTDFGPTNFSIGFSDLSEVWPGAGNFTADPLFVDEAGYDFHLQAASPAIDSGDPTAALDADGTRTDLGAFPFAGTANPLIAFGSDWTYLDDGSDQGGGWTQADFDDSAWASGPAQLGYGDGDEATVLDYGPDSDNKYITSYFRRSVVLGNPAQYSGLELHVLRDDSAVMYINGQEVWRDNLPAGAIDYLTLAVTPLGTAEEGIIQTAIISADVLVPGTNVIAVEIHQVLPTSTDTSFDMEMVGLPANQTPSVALLIPSEGATFAAPATIALEASASDSDGSVAKVEFFHDGVLVGEDDSDPFTFAWSGVTAGSFALTAVATDDLGATNESVPIHITVNVASDPVTNSLVVWGSDWKYLDNGSDQGTAWRENAFDDSSWASGPAQLGYGDGDEATVVEDNGTPGYNPGDTDRYLTTYFRRSLVVTNPTQYTSVDLSVLFDDGTVVYLNGNEVFRGNMPGGTINYDTPAILSGVGDNTILQTNLPSSVLQAGTNIVAVEIHQDAHDSSDISFDYEMLGLIVNELPSVALTSPSDGTTFTAPATIALEADASDGDGAVTIVEFFRNGVLVGEDLAEPYTFDWTGVAAGNYTLTAVATDDQGATNESAPIQITVNAPSGSVTNTIVGWGSDWNYLDNGSDQGAAWHQNGFDDSSWTSGPAQLGYGDGDEATVVEDNGTPGYNPSDTDRYLTTYFRHSFTVTDPALYNSLDLSVLFDDGAVVYLNGNEVFRCNMPGGTIAFDTPAILSGVGDNTVWQTNLSSGLLLPGENIVAVEIHQDAPESSDISFDFELQGIISGATTN